MCAWQVSDSQVSVTNSVAAMGVLKEITRVLAIKKVQQQTLKTESFSQIKLKMV